MIKEFTVFKKQCKYKAIHVTSNVGTFNKNQHHQIKHCPFIKILIQLKTIINFFFQTLEKNIT